MSRGRGGVLLEVMLSLVLFVSASSVVLGLIRQSVASVERARERLDGLDLARSAISMIESGLASAETLSGPVSAGPLAWDADSGAPAGFGDPAAGPEWLIEIETERSEHPGLVLLTVRAVQETFDESAPATSVTLRQLVRTAGGAEGEIGDVDDLFDGLVEPAPGASGGGTR